MNIYQVDKKVFQVRSTLHDCSECLGVADNKLHLDGRIMFICGSCLENLKKRGSV